MKSPAESDRFDADLRAAIDAIAAGVPDDVYARLRARHYPTTPRPVRRMVVAGASVAAAIALAVFLATSGSRPAKPTRINPGRQVAFAGWTARPTPAPSGQVAAAKRTCIADTTSTSTQAGTSQPTPEATWTPVVSDTRGPYTLVVMTAPTTTGTERAVCLTSSRPTTGLPELFTLSGSLGPTPAPDAVGQEGLGQNAGGADTVFVAVAGRDVASVSLTLSDGKTVEATLANGTCAAWWPGSASIRSIVARGTTGGTFTQTFRSSGA